jgi:hypothetical protein
MSRTLLTAVAVGIALTGLVFSSCNETPLDARVTANATNAPETDQIFYAKVIQSVTGSAHLITEPRDRTVTFTIRKYADGSVDGWYNASARGPGGADVQVRVHCLHVVGNEAWASGTIVDAVNPNNIGRPVAMRFIDNGEGADAQPDEIGVIWNDYDCETEPDLTTRMVTIGNFQVRG